MPRHLTPQQEFAIKEFNAYYDKLLKLFPSCELDVLVFFIKENKLPDEFGPNKEATLLFGILSNLYNFQNIDSFRSVNKALEVDQIKTFLESCKTKEDKTKTLNDEFFFLGEDPAFKGLGIPPQIINARYDLKDALDQFKDSNKKYTIIHDKAHFTLLAKEKDGTYSYYNPIKISLEDEIDPTFQVIKATGINLHNKSMILQANYDTVIIPPYNPKEIPAALEAQINSTKRQFNEFGATQDCGLIACLTADTLTREGNLESLNFEDIYSLSHMLRDKLSGILYTEHKTEPAANIPATLLKEVKGNPFIGPQEVQ